jgi:hypothetical protein
MARSLVRQMSFSEEEWTLAQRLYRNAVGIALAPLGVAAAGPMTLDPRAFRRDQSSMGKYHLDFGFFAAQLARAIRLESISVEHEGFIGNVRTIRPNMVGDRKAAIALVYWQGGGGHFVVVARQNSRGELVFLDPWDGQVREAANNGYTDRATEA